LRRQNDDEKRFKLFDISYTLTIRAYINAERRPALGLEHHTVNVDNSHVCLGCNL